MRQTLNDCSKSSRINIAEKNLLEAAQEELDTREKSILRLRLDMLEAYIGST
jgi:hypothetical protein